MRILNAQLTSCIGILLIGFLTSCDPYFYGPAEPVTHYRAGYEIRTLPPGYRTEMISGTRYYVYNNTYYRPRSGRYIVVDPPRRIYERPVVVQRLPYGYRVENYRGINYYRANNVYYRPTRSGYIIVERPY